MERVSLFASPLGRIEIRAEEDQIVGLRFADRPDPAPASGLNNPGRFMHPESCDPAPDADPGLSGPVLRRTEAWLAAYFSGADPGPAPPVRLRGTPFCLAVWELLRAIPYGEQTTYGSLAALLCRRLGLPRMSAQAIGGAMHRNPVAIVVPCHRVVGADGRLVGYGGGLERKRLLLKLERTRAPLPPEELFCLAQEGLL